MKYFGAGLGEMHKELGTMIRKADRLEVPGVCFQSFMAPCIFRRCRVARRMSWTG